MRNVIPVFLLFLIMTTIGSAQTTYLPNGSDEQYLLDKVQTVYENLCDSLCTSDLPESRKNAINYLSLASKYTRLRYDSIGEGWIFEDLQNTANYRRLSKIDVYDLQQMISENGEWTPDENGAINSKVSWFKTFYKKQYDFAYIKTPDFFMVLNPIISGTGLIQDNSHKYNYATPNTIFANSHGIEIRGWINKKLGFYTNFTDNQEQFPSFVNSWVNKYYQAVPGADYFLKPTSTKGAYDYLQANGYIDFEALKDHVNVTFGSGKHFIGDGFTSLFLTDFSSNMPFLQLRARIWKLNYECLYLELSQQYNKYLGDALLGHKFTTMHYVTYDPAPWMKLGFFESVVFNRPNVYEISYLNPMILTTSLDKFNGQGDKALLGFTGKLILAHTVQFYGQFMINEFRSKEFFGSKGWYGNKWGVQFGAKYFNAFTIKDLDIQAEVDVVRPYTYTAKDTIANYTNYNQPLADPLGAGFIKGIGSIRYKPMKNFTISGKFMYYIQGVDTGSRNYGNNIFNGYLSAYSDYGVQVINGPKSNCYTANLNFTYQIKRNLFIDLGSTYRSYTNNIGHYPDYSTTGTAYGPLTTTYYYLSVRLNAQRRNYDFF